MYLPTFFISHPSDDHEQAVHLADSLRSHTDVYIDSCRSDEPLTGDWRSEIYEALSACEVFVALVGTGHGGNSYYQFEIRASLHDHEHLGRPLLIPLYVGSDDSEPPASMEALSLPALGWDRIVAILIDVSTELRAFGRTRHSLRFFLDPLNVRSYLESLLIPGPGETLAMLMRGGRLPRFRQFTAGSTYPLSRLARQLPRCRMIGPIDVMLTGAHDPERVLHGAHLFGGLFAGTSMAESATSHLKSIHAHLGSRRGDIDGWPMIERQLLYTEAQLGDEEAKAVFQRKLGTPEGTAFDVAYNFRYYGGDLQLMKLRFEDQLLEECRPSDAFVTDVLTIIYKQVLCAVEQESPVLRNLRLDGWPLY